MRGIKFRVWHKKLKRFAPDDCNISFGENFVYFDVFDGDFDVECWDFKDVELLQYTGLKDKKGVEIYEGYIVTIVKAGDVERVGFGECYATADDNFCGCKAFGFRVGSEVLGGSDAGWGDGARVSENMLVIGNIYDNPELLDKE